MTHEQLNNIDIQYDLTALQMACITELSDLFYYLITIAKVDTSVCNLEKHTEFYYAVLFLKDCIKTPLHVAIEHYILALYQLEHTKKESNYWSDQAKKAKHLVKILLDYAKNTHSQSCIFSKDEQGHTPLMKAILSGGDCGREIQKIFIANGITESEIDITAFSSELDNQFIQTTTAVYNEHWNPIEQALQILNATFSPTRH